MGKTTDVIFEQNKIVVSFNKLIKNQNVYLEFIPINQYQLTCNKIVIENKNIVNHEVIINAADRNWYGYWEDNGDGTNVLRRSGNYNRYSFMV